MNKNDDLIKRLEYVAKNGVNSSRRDLARQAADALQPEGYPEPLSNFQEGQWWVQELDKMAGLQSATADQKRAVAVVHHLLMLTCEPQPPKPASAAVPDRSNPHGHCTHPQCKEIFATYINEHDRLMKYEPEGSAMHLNAAPPAPQALTETVDTDALLTHLGLDPQTYRTDGGWLNLPKIKAALANPDMYPRIEADHVSLKSIRGLLRPDQIAASEIEPTPQARELSDDTFNNLCREYEIQGTAEARLCGVFWLAGLRARDAK